jgi:hypothetical protein
MASAQIPQAHVPVAGQVVMTPEWYRSLAAIVSRLNEMSATLAAIESRVKALEDAGASA